MTFDRETSPRSLSSQNQDSITLRALILMKDAGIIIGREGANIKEIRESTNARVTVSPHIDDVQERIITIIGNPEQVAGAYAKVARNINSSELRGATERAMNSTPLTIRFLIPNSRFGAIIGKGGSRIREIQEESNARLTAKAEILPNSGERILEMTGAPDKINIATNHVCLSLLDHSNRPCYDRPYRPENAHRKSSRYMETRTFFCPISKVGPMIGRKGNRINRIRTEAHCKINIEESIGGGDRPFVVIGNPHDVDHAIRSLEAALRRELQRDLRH